MDNESSTALKNSMTTMDIKYQLVTPSNHRSNSSDRLIYTFKNQLIVVICSVDADFHLQLWYRMLQQATISLNLLQQSSLHPHLSIYTHIHGGFDYNRTPISPQGKKLVIHNRPNNRASWEPHGGIGWYIGPSMEYYRCHKAYTPKNIS